MRSFVWCLVASVCAVVALPVCAASSGTTGKPLAGYLDALNGRGQVVIYSSDLVTDEMHLATSPESVPTLAELQDLLRPFGLTATSGPAGSFLVVIADEEGRREQGNTQTTAAAKIEPIPEIVVTSSLHRLNYSRPETHTYLDRELVARMPTTADEAVRVTQRLPGTASGGVSAQNHVRGGDANEVLFLFDGLRLYEPYHLKDFQAIATIVNANAIGGMDFYTGAFPAHFGDRMSGVLSVELREPQEPTETELALSFFNASILSAGTFGEHGEGDWLLTARRGNLDLIVDVIEPEFGSPDYQDYLAHVGWEFGPRARLSANFLASDDKLRLADADRGETADAAYTNKVGWFKWQAQWSASLSSDSILAISDIGNRRSGDLALAGIVAGSLHEVRDFSALEFRQDWRWLATDSWMLNFGFDIKDLDARYRFQSVQAIESPFDSILGNQPSTLRDFDLAPSGVQYAAYAEVRARLLDKWTIDAGLRWDQQNYTTARNDKQYSPRLSVLYAPSDATEVRIGWGQYYQAQEINELQVADGITEFSPAQQAEHVVLNVQHRFANDIDMNLSVYRKTFRRLQRRFENSFNTLTLLPEIQFDRVMVDAPAAESLGADLLLSHGSADENLLWWLGYSWSEIEDELASGDVVRSWDQTHTFKGGLTWRWGKWDFSAAAEIHTGWPRTLLNGELVGQPNGGEDLVLSVSERNASRYSTYQTLDIRLRREFELSRGDLTVFLDVTNLLDRQNLCCIEYSLATDGSLASRDKHWLPLLPSLGVTWRF